jgi:hypothetical protein
MAVLEDEMVEAGPAAVQEGAEDVRSNPAIIAAP